MLLGLLSREPVHAPGLPLACCPSWAAGPTAVGAPNVECHGLLVAIFFIFIFFNFVFYKNIFLFSKFTGMYPAAPLPGGRGFSVKSFAKNLRPDL